ncbi:adenosylcobinamide amidohydrolase [Actinoplanes sp. NBRC 14428]|uniref:Adenosylcobinamide amidohydrolase n=1 Tax=Pseudosporangium ferrugineum TaxID=439699 RepID=A0A2T0SF77_9ACTN|nr:adenosylcobinamide amidohydrolase [Pseudosporangium ferrugineum]PRY32061.1 adenosylcobinamide amidohydrolase [Pseudosporangium ferrugineum]BCJ49699.1 adenosylcobinamide amidohydrolase [Actinoplanes sp. NBRC 14428]
MIGAPVLTRRAEEGREVPVLVWRPGAPVLAISSAVVGGGIGPCRWVVNATVPMSYDRDDPATHLGEIAGGLGLSGPGVGLLTGVDVAGLVAADDGGVRLWATVGLGAPIQAAADDDPVPPHAGTINIVAWVPRRLSDGALVNAVATVTEAKTQAIRELGLAATGTATDAVAVLCPPDGPAAAYAGPRAEWGRHLARAAHRAVLTGGAAKGRAAWSDRQDLPVPSRAPAAT